MSTVTVKWSKNKTSDFINAAITIFFMFIFRFICPTFGPVTEVGVGVLGVFIGCIYGWTFCNIFWPSILCLFAIQYTGYQSMADTLTVAFTSNPCLTMIFMFPMIYVLEQSGIVKFFAFKIINAKFAQGKPWIVSFLLIFAAEIASGFVNLYVGNFLVWALFYEIVALYNIPKGKYTQFMVVGIAFAACMGGSIFAFSPGVLAPMGAYESQTGNIIAQGTYFLYAFPTITMFNVLFVLMGRFILRIDLKGLTIGGVESDMKLDGYQKFIFGVLVVFILLLLLPSFLPGEWKIISILSTLSTKGVPGLMLVFLAIINLTGGTSITEAFDKGQNWSCIMMICAIMAIGGAIKDDATGLTVLLNTGVNAIFEGKGVLVFVLVAVLLSSFVTNFCNNLVVGMLFITLVANYAESIGASGQAMALIICQTMNACMMTPAGGASAAILFGNKEWVDSKTCMLYGVAIWLIVSLVCFASYPYACLLV